MRQRPGSRNTRWSKHRAGSSNPDLAQSSSVSFDDGLVVHLEQLVRAEAIYLAAKTALSFRNHVAAKSSIVRDSADSCARTRHL